MRAADAAEEARRREESGLRAILGLPVEAEEADEPAEGTERSATALVDDDAPDDSSPAGGRRGAD
jgi:hypothetical protein